MLRQSAGSAHITQNVTVIGDKYFISMEVKRLSAVASSTNILDILSSKRQTGGTIRTVCCAYLQLGSTRFGNHRSRSSVEITKIIAHMRLYVNLGITLIGARHLNIKISESFPRFIKRGCQRCRHPRATFSEYS